MDNKQLTINQNGQSLIEVIVACVVGILVVMALTYATLFSLRNANFAKTSAQATKLAQEGLERVRTGRDRNQQISGGLGTVTSWNGDTTGSGSIWSYPIKANCITNLYFNVNASGILQYLACTATPSSAESVGQFKRVIILSDDLNRDGVANDDYQNQKEVTIVVTWTDSTGPHESKLASVLRRI